MSNARKKRIYVVDNHVMIREGIRELLNRSSDLVICGDSGSAEEALQEIGHAKPDLAVIELSLPGTGGLELLKDLKSRHPDLPVLVLSLYDEIFFAQRVLRLGARGYIMKHQAVSELKVAIHRILDGGIYVSQKMSDRLLRSVSLGAGSPAESPIDRLSDREVEVFEMIGKGLGPSEIARRLHLSVKTIEAYRAKIKEKLDLKDGAHLFRQALAWVQGSAFP